MGFCFYWNLRHVIRSAPPPHLCSLALFWPERLSCSDSVRRRPDEDFSSFFFAPVLLLFACPSNLSFGIDQLIRKLKSELVFPLTFDFNFTHHPLLHQCPVLSRSPLCIYQRAWHQVRVFLWVPIVTRTFCMFSSLKILFSSLVSCLLVLMVLCSPELCTFFHDQFSVLLIPWTVVVFLISFHICPYLDCSFTALRSPSSQGSVLCSLVAQVGC